MLSRAVTGFRAMVRKLMHWPASRGASAREVNGLDSNQMPVKAEADDFPARFREIVADPINLLISRDPRAGVVNQGHVYLHNGNRVSFSGPLSYYGQFSDILIINRGVHEPTEEFVFQQLLAVLRSDAVMLELGAYWGHYSMWLKKAQPASTVYLVEPESPNIAVGRHNFALNGYRGTFIQDFVGKGHFTVDRFLADTALPRLDVLHSDIQGFEMEMLDGADASLRQKRVDYVFVSTHSDSLHYGVRDRLEGLGYVVEIACDFERETSSYDGLVFARSPHVLPVVPTLRTFGRLEVLQTSPATVVRSLQYALGNG